MPLITQDKKVALITGASSGIGRATALVLAKTGYSLALNGRDQDRLEGLLNELNQKGMREGSREGSNDFALFPADLCSKSGCSSMIRGVYDHFGRVDVLVNSAGVLHYGRFDALKPEEMREMMEINYWGMVECTRAVLPQMIRQKSGHIVNIASTAGRRGFPMESGYCASKFAVVGFSEALRLELAEAGVTVSLICPGIVDTPMAAPFLNSPGVRETIRPLSSVQVASWVQAAIEKGHLEITRPWSTKIGIFLGALWPGMADWVILKRVKRISELLSGAHEKE